MLQNGASIYTPARPVHFFHSIPLHEYSVFYDNADNVLFLS